MPRKGKKVLVIWEVEVKRLSELGFEKLFTTNYLAATKEEAEDHAISNARRGPSECIIAHAKRSKTLERTQQCLFAAGYECPQSRGGRAKRNRQGRQG